MLTGNSSAFRAVPAPVGNNYSVTPNFFCSMELPGVPINITRCYMELPGVPINIQFKLTLRSELLATLAGRSSGRETSTNPLFVTMKQLRSILRAY